LYGQRWQIETNFRHLKQTLRMDVLRCQTIEGVRKELTMYALVYNLVRLVMCEAASHQGVPVERISFVDAVRWLAEAVDDDAPLHWHNRNDPAGPNHASRSDDSRDWMNQPRHFLRNAC
jgi:hypothetical protein